MNKIVANEYQIHEMEENMKRTVNDMLELEAYRRIGYTPEQVQELHDKHWNECRQIALYDDQIKQMQEHIDRLKDIIDGLCGYVGGANNG